MQRHPKQQRTAIDSNPAMSSTTTTTTTSSTPALNTFRKSVSVSLPPTAHSTQSAAHEKILARKPTPFNSDLSAAIRSSGLGAAVTDPKTVSIAVPPGGREKHSAAHDKILARKPTPFNSDLSAAIRSSGLNAAVPDPKAVSLAVPVDSSRPDGSHSASYEKILARKPTPFNADLSAAIKSSGLDVALTGGEAESDHRMDTSDSTPTTATLANSATDGHHGIGRPDAHVNGNGFGNGNGTMAADLDLDAVLDVDATIEEVEEEVEEDE